MADYTLEPITENTGYTLTPISESVPQESKLKSTAKRVYDSTMGIPEAAYGLTMGMAGWAGGVATGLSTLIMTGDIDAAKAVQSGVEEKFQFQPKTQMGQDLTRYIGKIIDVPFAAIEGVADVTGEILQGSILDKGIKAIPKDIRNNLSNNPALPANILGKTLDVYDWIADTREKKTYLLNIAGQLAAPKAGHALVKELPRYLKDMTGRNADVNSAIYPETKTAFEERVKQAEEQTIAQPEIVQPTPTSGERGSVTLKQEPEKPPLHEFPKDIQERWDAAIPTEPNAREKISDKLNTFYNKLSRTYEDLPRTGEFAPLQFELLNMQKYKGIASDKATRAIEGIETGLDKQLHDVFTKKVILDDLYYCAEKGMDLPYGFTPDRLGAEKIIIDDLAAKHPEIQKAIEQRKAVWDDLKSQYINAMKDIGFNVEERFNNPDYFHHQVIEMSKIKGVMGAGNKLQTPSGRGFLKQREGSQLDINRDYIQVEHDVMAQMIHDIKTAEIIKFVDDHYNQVESLKGQFGKEWKENIPEGHDLWQPREGNVFYMTDTIPAKIANELVSGALEDYGITANDLSKALAVGGKRREFVLKNEIIKTLDNLSRPSSDNIISQSSAWLMRQWKEKVALINPKGVFKYNARNISGDAEAGFVGNVNGFKKTPQAFKELWNAFYGNGKMTPELQKFFDLGGFESTLQSIEMKSFGDMEIFKHLYDNKKTIKDVPGALWDKYWKGARLATDLRETLLRYANFLEYREQMKNSPDMLPKNYGASIPEEIQALGDIDRRAYWLQNDLLGAYDRVGVLGQDLRKHIWPFWSWKEVNARRYMQLWKNAASDGNLASTVGKQLGAKTPVVAYNIGKLAVKVTGVLALLEIYNNAFFQQEEQDLPKDVRDSAHIVFGRDKEGNVLYFNRLGMFQDFLSNFGLDNAPHNIRDVFNGKMTVKEMAVDMAKSPLNVIVSGVSPWFKIPAELLTGRKTFPDVTKMGTIRDKKLHLAQQLKLGDEYKALADLPSAGYEKTLKNLFVYSADPGQSAYFDIMDKKRRFGERNGKESEGYFITPKGNALYNYKLSLRYKDIKSAEHYLDEYVALGGTAQGLMTSVKAMNPLYGMSQLDKMQFLDSLDSEDMAKLDKAINYYMDVLSE